MNGNCISCNTAEEYLKALSLCNSIWWEPNDECHWVFRGQDSTCELIPSVYRRVNDGTLKYQDAFDRLHTRLIKSVPDMGSAITNIASDKSFNLDEEHQKRLSEIIKAAFVEIELTEKFLARGYDLSIMYIIQR